uniref:Potassium channel n=1 Tax=Ananas comosus var. bracteatus TaxID=296719 RepID=A0A6V7PG60_ANACO|nr:unnamed protein product [Ananas comosus var. bracteatus]
MSRRVSSSAEIRNLAAVSSGLLTAFVAANDQTLPRLRKHVIAPYDRRYRWWQMFLILLVIYSAWASPFELAFQKVGSGSLLAIDLVVDVFFGVDIIVSFFVAYLDGSTYLLVDDRKKIALRYVTRPWFAMDVASTLPFQVIYRIVTGKHNGGSVFGFINLLRLWRLRRVSSLFTRLEKDIRFSYFWTRFVKLICVTLFAYMISWTAAYGLGTPMPCTGPSLLSPPSVTGTCTQKTRGEAVQHLLHALQYRPHLLHHRKHDQPHSPQRNANIYHEGQSTPSLAICKQEPAPRGAERTDASTHAAQVQDHGAAAGGNSCRPAQGGAVEHRAAPVPKNGRVNLPIQGISPDFIAQLVSEMKAEYFPPKVDIILQNEMPTDCYIIVSGAVDVLTNKNGTEKFVSKLGPADMVGEIGVIFNMPQPFTVRSRKLSQVVRISHQHLRQIVQPCNIDAEVIFSNFLQYLKNLREEIVEELPFIEELNCGINENLIPSEELPNCDASISSEKEGTNIKGLRKTLPIRVIIHAHRLYESRKMECHSLGRLTYLPDSIDELMKLAEKSFGQAIEKILTADGAEVEDLLTLRDNDHLFIC